MCKPLYAMREGQVGTLHGIGEVAVRSGEGLCRRYDTAYRLGSTRERVRSPK